MTSFDTTAPREIQVTRYVCPHCSRGHSKRDAATAHIARCWKNPALRGCKSCVHFEQGRVERCGCGHPHCDDYDSQPDICLVGRELVDGKPVTGCSQWKSTTDIEETR